MTTAEAKMAAKAARIVGQVHGIRRMIRTGRPCEEVVAQLAAALGALRHLSVALTAAHLAHVRATGPAIEPDTVAAEITGALVPPAKAVPVRRVRNRSSAAACPCATDPGSEFPS